jgi:hypothetical protein
MNYLHWFLWRFWVEHGEVTRLALHAKLSTFSLKTCWALVICFSRIGFLRIISGEWIFCLSLPTTAQLHCVVRDKRKIHLKEPIRPLMMMIISPFGQLGLWAPSSGVGDVFRSTAYVWRIVRTSCHIRNSARVRKFSLSDWNASTEGMRSPLSANSSCTRLTCRASSGQFNLVLPHAACWSKIRSCF